MTTTRSNCTRTWNETRQCGLEMGRMDTDAEHDFAVLRAAGQEGAAETMARQERTLGSMADAAAAARSEHAPRSEHARRLDQQRRRDAAPLLITPHRCRHRVFASNSSLPSSCGRSSTMKSSLHACAADCTQTRLTTRHEAPPPSQLSTGQRRGASCWMAPSPHVPEPYGRKGTSRSKKP